MSQPNPANWRWLSSKDDRIKAKIHAIAANDTHFGGAKALVMVKRLPRLNRKLDLSSVVTAAYHSSKGYSTEYFAYECPECDTVWLGLDAACKCCSRESWGDDQN